MTDIKYPPYLENVDYWQLVLDLALVKGVNSSGRAASKEDIIDMHMQLRDSIVNSKSKLPVNPFFYKWWKCEMKQKLKTQLARDQAGEFLKMNNGKTVSDGLTWFVTIGINPLVNDIPLVKEVIENLMNPEWLDEAVWVYENHTEFGEKLHVMCKLVVKEKIMKSVLIQKICRTKGISKIVEMNQGRTSTYVSVLPYVPARHDNYIDLIKTDKKSDLLDLDIIFREKNNLKDRYSF